MKWTLPIATFAVALSLACTGAISGIVVGAPFGNPDSGGRSDAGAPADGGRSDGGAMSDGGSSDAGSSADVVAPDAGPCVPKTCVSQVSCGTPPDGCGGQLDCGSSCPSGQTCGGGGYANVCGDPDSNIIAADRRTIWNPGLAAAGGIPNRTTIYKTLSPSGGDDTKAIQSALDSCPANQVVKLAAGTFNITGDGLIFHTSNCTLRGSGTGTPGSGAGGTRLVKADRDTNGNFAVLYMKGSSLASTSTNLAEDAVKGSYTATLVSNPGLKVGEVVLIDHITDNDPQVYWGPNHNPPGGGSRRWFCRQDRSLSQLLEVTAVNGNVLTFATPFHITFKTAYTAQLTRFSGPILRYSGVEDLYVWGGKGGDYHGNIAVVNAAYSWIKNVESHWSVGTSIGFYSTYRCELRDSYIHETPDPNPGGSGYLSGLNYGASDNLVENNIMWYGNKVAVIRASGGGNVFAYNYTDDGFGSAYPNLGESGVNAGHFGTPHMELLEGNYSWNYTGDAYWGNSIYITAFRNHLSCLRGAHPPLKTYTANVNGTIYPYFDAQARTCARFQSSSWWHNMVGNVLGFQGQTLLSYSSPTYKAAEVGWLYDQVAPLKDERAVVWRLGTPDDTGPNTAVWDPQVAATLQRDGNWDWYTQSQRWHGVGGDAGTGTPKTLPPSLYLREKPAFFGSNPWPWVDPSTGAVYTLPAKARFDAIPAANFPSSVAFR